MVVGFSRSGHPGASESHPDREEANRRGGMPRRIAIRTDGHVVQGTNHRPEEFHA